MKTPITMTPIGVERTKFPKPNQYFIKNLAQKKCGKALVTDG